jgi:hypothetical protein
MRGDQANATTSRSLSAINFLVGLWLAVSPYVLHYATSQAKWQQTVIGALIAIFAAVRFFAPQERWASWLNVIGAAWLVIAPYVTGYRSSAAYWNEVVFGIVVLVLALWNAGLDTMDVRRHGHGQPV